MANSDNSGAWIRDAREARGWSQLVLARKLIAAGEDTGVSVPELVESMEGRLNVWENGRSGVSRRYLQLLESVLERHTEATPANTGLILPWTAEGARQATREVSEEGSMHRRMFLALGGAALTEVALDWLIATPAVDVEQLAGRRLLDGYVDELDEIVAKLRSMDDQFGGGAVLAQAQAQIGHVSGLLRNCRYTESVGRHLMCTASELLRVAGWTAFDASEHPLAQRYWMAALRTAHAADDDQLGANILGCLSCQAKDRGHPLDALKFAEAARSRHSARSPRLTAILHMRAAQAYAFTGDEAACRSAIDAAGDSLRSTSPVKTDPAYAYWLNEPHRDEMAGYVWMRLERWDLAEEHLLLSLDDGTRGRETALRKAFLGRVHANQGDPERAVAVADEAIDLLLSDVDSERCVGHVRSVETALEPYGELASVSEFSERVALLIPVSSVT